MKTQKAHKPTSLVQLVGLCLVDLFLHLLIWSFHEGFHPQGAQLEALCHRVVPPGTEQVAHHGNQPGSWLGNRGGFCLGDAVGSEQCHLLYRLRIEKGHSQIADSGILEVLPGIPWGFRLSEMHPV